MANEVAFAYDRNSIHKHRCRAVDKYQLFVAWLGETNPHSVYREFRAHLLSLREEEKYPHQPIRFPAILDGK